MIRQDITAISVSINQLIIIRASLRRYPNRCGELEVELYYWDNLRF